MGYECINIAEGELEPFIVKASFSEGLEQMLQVCGLELQRLE